MKRMLRGALVLAVGFALAAGGSYAATKIGAASISNTAAKAALTTDSTCDVDGVRVSYAVSYNRVVAGYAVDAVHVVDIASQCMGQTVQVVLKGASNSSLAGANVSAVVTASTVDLGLGPDVAAAEVNGVVVALSGASTASLPESTSSTTTNPVPTASVTTQTTTPVKITAFAPPCSRGKRSGDIIHGSDGPDCLYGSARADIVLGEGGNDLLVGRSGNDRLAGGSGSDFIYGDAGDDHLDGGTGNDNLHGGPGDDVIEGGPGDDVLRGGPGNDILRGGPGRDTCIGGGGHDRFTGCEVTVR